MISCIISSLGEKDYLAAYHQVLATQEMWFIKVILLGAPRLGKTTARRRLTGEIKDISSSGEEEQPSTGVSTQCRHQKPLQHHSSGHTHRMGGRQ